jgi:ADP-heptose:LPS heptosyltransferase
MNRLVVLELHHLGDAVMALPFLRGALEKYRVTVVCRPFVAELLRVITRDMEILPAAPSWRQVSRQVRALNLGTRDAITCVWADTRAHLAMAAGGAGTRVGFPMTAHNYYASEVPWRRRRLMAGKILAIVGGLFRPLLTHPLTRESVDQHHMKDWAQLAHCLGFEPRESPPWFAAPAAPEAVTAFTAAQQGRKIVVVHPGGRLPAKRWPYFPELLQNLARRDDVAVVVVRPPGESVPDPVGSRQVLFEAQGWTDFLGVLNLADAVISNDSAAAHLAAALGRPVVSIFGSGSPDWFAPWGNRHLVAAPEGVALYPFIDHGVPDSLIHLRSIPVSLVESRLRTALNAG